MSVSKPCTVADLKFSFLTSFPGNPWPVSLRDSTFLCTRVRNRIGDNLYMTYMIFIYINIFHISNAKITYFYFPAKLTVRLPEVSMSGY